jgi:hypothetical protein
LFGSIVQIRGPKTAVRTTKATIDAPTIPTGLRQRAESDQRRRGTRRQPAVVVAVTRR